MNDLAKGLIAPIIVFFTLLVAGLLVVDQTTDSALILDSSITASSGAQADPFADDSDPFADDAVAPAQGQIDTYLEGIADGLLKWVFVVTGAGAIFAILWFFISRFQQARVVGPSGHNDAFVAWMICMLLYLAACVGAYFYFIDPLGVDELMDDTLFFAFVGMAAVLGCFSYWIATALAASPVMTPSVPFAHYKARS